MDICFSAQQARFFGRSISRQSSFEEVVSEVDGSWGGTVNLNLTTVRFELSLYSYCKAVLSAGEWPLAEVLQLVRSACHPLVLLPHIPSVNRNKHGYKLGYEPAV